jgi:hypothetical protein
MAVDISLAVAHGVYPHKATQHWIVVPCTHVRQACGVVEGFACVADGVGAGGGVVVQFVAVGAVVFFPLRCACGCGGQQRGGQFVCPQPLV